MAEISIEHDHPTLRLDESKIRPIAQRIISDNKRTVSYLTIVLSEHAAVRNLNRQFLDRDRNTDVLAFPLGDDDGEERQVDGEVYIDLDTAFERAPEYDTTFEHEACRYIIHGILHLLGYDDVTPEGKQQMRALEDRYLAL
jgi:rRNA maturation RNase YbeY